MILRDRDTGRGAAVNDDNRLVTIGAIAEERLLVNLEKQEAYSAVISKTPTGAGDCFFYIINNSDDPLIIARISLQVATAESVQVKLGDSGTVGGTHATLTPVNRTARSSNAAQVTAESGVDITGLSGGLVVDEIYGSVTMRDRRWFSGLILPRGTMFSLYAVTGAVALKSTVSFYFRKR